MPNCACNKQDPHWLGEHYLTKVSCEISAWSLPEFFSKGRKSKKNYQLCIIMMIDPSK